MKVKSRKQKQSSLPLTVQTWTPRRSTHQTSDCVQIYGRQHSIAQLKSVSIKKKKFITSKIVRPGLGTTLYDSEICRVRKRDESGIEVFGMRCCRRLLRITRRGRVSNEDALKNVREE